MSRKSLTIENYNTSQIKEMIDSNDSYHIGIKLFAMYQVSLGRSCLSLADIFHVSGRQISNWVHRFSSSGLKGLMDRPGRGIDSLLSSDQQKRLQKLLDKESPSDYGINSGSWNGPVLRAWIEQYFGVRYSRSHIYNLLKRLGYSYQKSRGFYPEADPKAQEKFKETLKKTTGKSY